MQSGEPHWPSKLLRILDAGDNGWVWRVMFSPDGRLLATGAGGAPVRLWDPNTGSLVSELEANTDGVTAIAFSPDGRLLATGNYDNTVRLWDLPTDTLRTLDGHTRAVWGVSFSPDGQLLASASGDGTVRLWDPITGATARIFRGHADKVHGVAFSWA